MTPKSLLCAFDPPCHQYLLPGPECLGSYYPTSPISQQASALAVSP